MSLFNFFKNEKTDAADDCYTPILDYFSERDDELFSDLMRHACWLFIGDEEEFLQQANDEQVRIVNRFQDYLIFEHTQASLGSKTLLEYFLEHADLNKTDQHYFQNVLQQQQYSVFLIEDVTAENLRVRDVLADETYVVKKQTGDRILKKGCIMIWRIIPNRNGEWIFFGNGATVFNQADAVCFQKDLDKRRVQWKEEGLNALDFEDDYYHQGALTERLEREVEQYGGSIITPEGEQYLDEMQQREEAIVIFLDRHQLKVSLKEIRETVVDQSMADVMKLLHRILSSCLDRPTEQEADDFGKVFMEYANNLRKLASLAQEKRDDSVSNTASAKPRSKQNIGRNDPCYCGSGKKYKKCCLIKNSPDVMIEHADRYPVEYCMIQKDWSSLVNIVIVRKNPSTGKILFASFLVDTYCLGVKNALAEADGAEVSLDSLLSSAPFDMIEAEYEFCRGLILGAIDFAKNLGVEPHEDWEQFKNFVEADKPFTTEHRFGKDGKPLYIQGPDDDVDQVMEVLGDKIKNSEVDVILKADSFSPGMFDSD